MSATIINLEEYRRKKAAEKSAKRLRGLGFPKDYSPFNGPDDLPEDFGHHNGFDPLKLLGLKPGDILDDSED